MDGSWRWSGRGWEWLPGAWVVPPVGCYYAAPYARWLKAGSDPQGEQAGELFYFPASWYPDAPSGKCASPEVCEEALPPEKC